MFDCPNSTFTYNKILYLHITKSRSFLRIFLVIFIFVSNFLSEANASELLENNKEICLHF